MQQWSGLGGLRGVAGVGGRREAPPSLMRVPVPTSAQKQPAVQSPMVGSVSALLARSGGLAESSMGAASGEAGAGSGASAGAVDGHQYARHDCEERHAAVVGDKDSADGGIVGTHRTGAAQTDDAEQAVLATRAVRN